MLLDRLKKILPNNDNGYPVDFQKIIHNLSPKSESDNEKILFIHTGGAVSLSAYEWAFD